MNRLIIIGASGHGKVVADIARLNGYEDIVFLDDDEKLKKCGKYKVIGRTAEEGKLVGDVFVAIGNNGIRRYFCEKYAERLIALIHPNAVIADDVAIGIGTVVMAGAIINPEVKIGKGCIVNTAASIDHECRIGDFVHIAVGAHLCGAVCVNNFTWIGAGAIVINNLSICRESIIGAGAVVIGDIGEVGTYVGVPARKKNDTE